MMSRNSSFSHHSFERKTTEAIGTNQLILGEGLEFALYVTCALAGLEAKVSVARNAKFAVRPLIPSIKTWRHFQGSILLINITNKRNQANSQWNISEN
jgi:hypothetical protein